MQPNELEAIYSSWSSEDLIKAITVERYGHGTAWNVERGQVLHLAESG